MVIKKVTDAAFKKYGRILDLELPDLGARLAKTEIPGDVVYVASDEKLEECSEFADIRDSVYGGMPIQIGYCNGNNHLLNAVEYHRDSEINFTQTGAVLIVGSQQDIEDDHTYDTAKMEAFELPANMAVELYGTTLHYAPCNLDSKGFQVAIILPRGTNTDKPALSGKCAEDKLMTAKNKWLIAHKDSGLEASGAFIGLKGENLSV